MELLIFCGYVEFLFIYLYVVQLILSGVLRFYGKGFYYDWIVNWVNFEDEIIWDIWVVELGEYWVVVRYICVVKDFGLKI